MAKNGKCYIVEYLNEPRYGINCRAGRITKQIYGIYHHLDNAVARVKHMYDLVTAYVGDPDFNIELVSNGEGFDSVWTSSWYDGDRLITYRVRSYRYED